MVLKENHRGSRAVSSPHLSEAERCVWTWSEFSVGSDRDANACFSRGSVHHQMGQQALISQGALKEVLACKAKVFSGRALRRHDHVRCGCTLMEKLSVFVSQRGVCLLDKLMQSY